MRLDAQIKGAQKLQRALAGLSDQQIRKAAAEGLNMAAGRGRVLIKQEMAGVFDRPTPYILNSVTVAPATEQKLSVWVGPTYLGAKGIEPQRILQAQAFGGRRRDKRSEVALRRAGILPRGYQTAVPATPLAGTDDGRGNIKGSFVVQLLSYFQSFGEQGYRANMSARRMRTINNGSKTKAARRFFVAYGRMRGGARMTRFGEPDRRASNLAPGIWVAMGTGGVDVRPVLMFVRTGTYTPRLSMEAVWAKSGMQELSAKWIRGRIYEAFKSAG